jgi:FlaA1/EpsC-like NDP-sugar epimerase
MIEKSSDIVVIGGTGTLGHALARRLADHDGLVTIISRCELRQKRMRTLFPQFRYLIGDITSPAYHEWPDCDIAFNFAAMKHVDTAEHNVGQCIKVNVLGAVNFDIYCEKAGVKQGIFTNTDKAVLPINAYGMSKGLATKYLLSKGDRYQVFNWGNILGSRGSVLEIFKESLERDGVVHITDLRMTRFWAHIDDIAGFMVENIGNGPGPHIPPMKAAKITDLVRALANVLGVTDVEFKEIGIRDGEKIHECLKSSHVSCMTSDACEQYTMEELEELVQRSLESGFLQ